MAQMAGSTGAICRRSKHPQWPWQTSLMGQAHYQKRAVLAGYASCLAHICLRCSQNYKICDEHDLHAYCFSVTGKIGRAQGPGLLDAATVASTVVDKFSTLLGQECDINSNSDNKWS